MAYNVTVRFNETLAFVNYHVDTDDPVEATVRVQQHLARKGLNETTITKYVQVREHHNFDVCI